MPWNGSGVFNRIYSWETDAANSLYMDATRTDTDTNDITANGLGNCVTRDGQGIPTASTPWGGFKITNVALGTNVSDVAIVSNANSLNMCEFRMTLTTGVAVTTSNVTAAGTIYVTPYKGNRIALYDGTNWHMRSSAEMSIATPSGVATLYDLYCYDNLTVPTLEALAWTSDSTRATSLALQNGVLCKSGDPTRRYLGSFRTILANKTEDSRAHRFVWNYYNRVVRDMSAQINSFGYTYTTATLRQANADATVQCDFVIGFSEDMVEATAVNTFDNTSAGVIVAVGFGLDSTTVAQIANTVGGYAASVSTTAGAFTQICAFLRLFPGGGRHFIPMLEYSTGTGTTTWNIGSTIGGVQGISGKLLG